MQIPHVVASVTVITSLEYASEDIRYPFSFMLIFLFLGIVVVLGVCTRGRLAQG